MEQRIIKFRAWFPKIQEMKFPYAMIQTEKGVVWYENRDSLWKYDQNTFEQNDKITIMQFTGLKDSKGKEIYEGDIVKGIHYEDLDTGIGINRLTMESPPFEVKWDSDMLGFNLYGSEDFTIIGNIYENPNLLTS